MFQPRSRSVLDRPHSQAMTQRTWHAPSGSLRAQRSNPSSRAKGAMDCFVARAPRNDVERDVVSHSRGMICPRFSFRCPSRNRGSRECRVRAAPAVSCARCTKKCAHEHTGSAEAVRHSLRNGFTAYALLSPATNSSCHRRRRIKADQAGWVDFASARLGTSNGCRDHTVLPYATSAVRPARREPLTSPKARPAITLRADAVASTASHPAFVTTRDTPLLPGKDGASW